MMSLLPSKANFTYLFDCIATVSLLVTTDNIEKVDSQKHTFDVELIMAVHSTE